MAEFDKLEISIEANASGAQSAIDGLSRSLGNLDKALNLKNAGGLLSTLKNLGSIPNLSNLGDAFKNIDLTQINAATKGLASNLKSASEAAQKLADTLKNIKTGDVSALKEKFDSINNANTSTNNGNPFKGWSEEAKAAGDNIRNAEEAARKTTEEFRSSIEALTEAIKKMGEKSKNITVKTPKVQTVRKETPTVGTTEGQLKLLGSALVISKELNAFLSGIGEKINKIGDMGFKISKVMLTPLKAVVNEYKEKLDKIGGYFENFRQKAQESLKKLSAFWKRVMKTFTFMLVRKAITAIIGEIKEATESLALFSQEMGTSFNDNLSNAIADLKWIGKAIVGAFEPIINYVVPVLNVLSAALVKVITLLGHFFAALTGQGYYMVAKKKVDDYAKSLKKAQKQTQLSIRGFDELNNLTTPKSSDSDQNNPASDWEMKPVSDKMKKFADMIKDLAKKLWEPIAKAWDRTKDYVISGFKYMVSELAKLGKSIGRDFLAVWRQEETVKMFENIFKIVGDIERVIGNLAKRFREAWDEGDKGFHILENIRDIFAILIQHVRNVTEYMVEWSDSIDFNPLLESVERLTRSLKKVADFIGSVFEDIMKNVVLKYVKWLAETGTPHLFETISKIIDKIDWEHIRRGLFIVEQAFENLLENVHTGVTNAIGAVGSAFAEWVNSEKFTKFMQSLANIMNQITADRVQKVLEGLGLAILHIAQAVADFVSSDAFQGFIEKIGKWIDNHSAEDIARYAEGIIKVAAACKLAGTAVTKLAGLVKVLTQFNTIRIGANIAKELAKINAVSNGAKTAKGIMEIPLPGFDKYGNAMMPSAKLSTILFGDIGKNMAAGGATAGATFATAFIGSVAAAIAGWNIGQLIDKKVHGDEGMGSFTEQMKGIKEAFSDGSWKDALLLWARDVDKAWANTGESVSKTGENISKSWSAFWQTQNQERSQALAELKADTSGSLNKIKSDQSQAWTDIKNSASTAVQNMKQDVSAGWNGMTTDISTALANVKVNVTQDWNNVKTDISTAMSGIKSDVSTKWAEIKADVSNKQAELKTSISQKWTDIKTFLNNSLNNIKAKFNSFSLASAGAKIINSLFSGLKSAWQSVSGWISNKVQEIKSKFNFNFSFNSSGSGGGIRTYATGGFPEDGWFRASQGEIMGEFDNGQSVVANNSQIIEGIQGGVERAMMNVLPTIVSAIENNASTVVVEGDTDKLFKTMVKKNGSMNKRTFGGSPLYA